MHKLLSKLVLSIILLASYALATINLNTATKEELMNLKGIGESKADAIIEYRKTNTFKSIEDLKNVNGIGDKTFENLKNDISISGKTTIPENTKPQKAKEASKNIKEGIKTKLKDKEDVINDKTKEMKDKKDKSQDSKDKASSKVKKLNKSE